MNSYKPNSVYSVQISNPFSKSNVVGGLTALAIGLSPVTATAEASGPMPIPEPRPELEQKCDAVFDGANTYFQPGKGVVTMRQGVSYDFDECKPKCDATSKDARVTGTGIGNMFRATKTYDATCPYTLVTREGEGISTTSTGSRGGGRTGGGHTGGSNDGSNDSAGGGRDGGGHTGG